MNIRNLKDYLVDVILHSNSTVSDGTQFGDSSGSWIIKNSTLAPHLQVVVHGEGVELNYDDDWQRMEHSVSWELFPEAYKQEIVSALEVNDRMPDSDMLTIRSLLSYVKGQLP